MRENQRLQHPLGHHRLDTLTFAVLQELGRLVHRSAGCVDDAVGADFARVLITDRHAGFEQEACV